MRVEFVNTKEWKINPSSFHDYIEKLKVELPQTGGYLTVAFVDDEHIKSLNKQYRNKDQSTDVLSFSFLNAEIVEPGERLIGEIYISIPTAQRQANFHQHCLEDELNKLFVHGFLHIFGYDHETDEEFEVMNKIEKKILGH